MGVLIAAMAFCYIDSLTDQQHRFPARKPAFPKGGRNLHRTTPLPIVAAGTAHALGWTDLYYWD
jgi:hypothetical protein